MSPRAQSNASSGSGRTILAIAAIALMIVIVAFVAKAKPRNELLDPASSGRTGSRGLVSMLRRFDNVVDLTSVLPTETSGTRVLVLVDRLSPEQSTELAAWVTRGGIAVIADNDSIYHQHSNSSGGIDIDSTIPRASCEIKALEHLKALKLSDINRLRETTMPDGDADGVGDAVMLSMGDGRTGCFGTGSSRFVVAEPRGDGFIVTLGDNWVWSNELLDEGDNAALARALLAPQDGTRVVYLRGTKPRRTANVEVGGDERLVDLIPRRLWMSLTTLGVGLMVFAMARGIRTGRPVIEQPLVPLEASHLVASTGNLMQRAGHAERAAQLLRYQLHRDLCTRYGVAPDLPLGALEHAVAQKFPDPRQSHFAEVFNSPPPTAITVQHLADLSARIRMIRKELL